MKGAAERDPRATSRVKFFEEYQKELHELYKKWGSLNPQHVLDWVKKHPKSALHARLEWDAEKAADAYRLWQIRFLIGQMKFEVKQDSKPCETRAFVSLKQDREGGDQRVGYTFISDVLSDDVKRAQLLAQAYHEIEQLQTKYGVLQELATVFRAFEKVKKRHRVD